MVSKWLELDLESQDDGPDESKSESGVAINDVVCTNVLQMNPLLIEKHQRLVHVLQAVDPHLALGRIRLQQNQSH